MSESDEVVAHRLRAVTAEAALGATQRALDSEHARVEQLANWAAALESSLEINKDTIRQQAEAVVHLLKEREQMRVDLAYYKGRSEAWLGAAHVHYTNERRLHAANAGLAEESWKFRVKYEKLLAAHRKLKDWCKPVARSKVRA